MKIYRRKEFLKLPSGTLYHQGGEWHFGDLEVKADSLENDWVCRHFNWIQSRGSEDAIDKLGEMLEKGTSQPVNEDYGREGCFEDDALFLVYERADLEQLKAAVEQAMEVS